MVVELSAVLRPSINEPSESSAVVARACSEETEERTEEMVAERDVVSLIWRDARKEILVSVLRAR